MPFLLHNYHLSQSFICMYVIIAHKLIDPYTWAKGQVVCLYLPIEVITWGSPRVLRSELITAAYLPPTGLWSCIHWCPTSNWHTPCYQWSKKELNSHIYSYNNHQACREAVEVFKLYTLLHTFMWHHALLCAYNMQQIKLIIHYLLWWQSCISVNV